MSWKKITSRHPQMKEIRNALRWAHGEGSRRVTMVEVDYENDHVRGVVHTDHKIHDGRGWDSDGSTATWFEGLVKDKTMAQRPHVAMASMYREQATGEWFTHEQVEAWVIEQLGECPSWEPGDGPVAAKRDAWFQDSSALRKKRFGRAHSQRAFLAKPELDVLITENRDEARVFQGPSRAKTMLKKLGFDLGYNAWRVHVID